MKKVIITILVIVVLVVAYYLISPLFITIEVNEALPEDVVPSGVENLSDEDVLLMEEMTKNMEEMAPVYEEMPDVSEERMVHPVMGSTGHPASGDVKVLETESGTVIRYENFSTINGPNLHVYLTKDLGAEEYIDLGEIKGTKGNINYSVPEGINIEDYKYVIHWCVPFRVLFNYAEIN